jgi:hypothetical protein
MIDEKPMKDVTNISLKMNFVERGSCGKITEGAL